MKFIKFKNEQEGSLFVANELIQAIKMNPNIKLGLATGSTPILMYQDLAKDYEKNKTNWSNVITFNLDEYIGLPANHEQSYKIFMDKHLFSKVNINKQNTHFPEHGSNYDELIKKWGELIFKF